MQRLQNMKTATSRAPTSCVKVANRRRARTSSVSVSAVVAHPEAKAEGKPVQSKSESSSSSPGNGYGPTFAKPVSEGGTPEVQSRLSRYSTFPGPALDTTHPMIGNDGENSDEFMLPVDYSAAEFAFLQLLLLPGLDTCLEKGREEVVAWAKQVEEAIEAALPDAYGPDQRNERTSIAAHTFLQRLLYRINRMVFFWFDDLANYTNERSAYLFKLRDRIESVWQPWEDQQMGGEQEKKRMQSMTLDEIKEQLRSRAAHDVNPPRGDHANYIADQMGLEGYKHLLAVGSLDGLVEASRQSRTYGGVGNEISCAGFKVLMEEYGAGRYNKKHSTFFASMMKEVGLQPKEELFFDIVPWQSLACINHNFMLTERRACYLRYNGGLTFFEVNGPSVYQTYLEAAQRLKLSEVASGYWALHIKEDERHGRQMVEDVAVPLAERYPKDGWQVLWGYIQEKSMGDRAGAALLKDLKIVDELVWAREKDPKVVQEKSPVRPVYNGKVQA